MSDSEVSQSSQSESFDSDSEFSAVGGQVEPYMFEPEAGEDGPDENEDEDSLTPDILEARQDDLIPVYMW